MSSYDARRTTDHFATVVKHGRRLLGCFAVGVVFFVVVYQPYCDYYHKAEHSIESATAYYARNCLSPDDQVAIGKFSQCEEAHEMIQHTPGSMARRNLGRSLFRCSDDGCHLLGVDTMKAFYYISWILVMSVVGGMVLSAAGCGISLWRRSTARDQLVFTVPKKQE